MKLADYMYEEVLGLEGRDQVRSCAELNQRALDWALGAASPAAVERLLARGRSLVFGPDREMTWGLGLWELSGGLQWAQQVGVSIASQSRLSFMIVASGIQFHVLLCLPWVNAYLA